MRHAILSVIIAALAGIAAAHAQPKGPDGNLPMAPGLLQDRLERADFTIVAVDDAGGGVMGARRLTLRFTRDGKTVKAKWKATGKEGDGWNNSPRREIAAYDIQDWFLQPDDYVVPPAAARCIDLDTYRPIDAGAKPNIEGTRCVFGALVAWLDNVEQPDPTLDRERFSTDPRYAYYFANLNLLAYLIGHKDARGNNFLIATDPERPQLFSIDNGIAFGSAIYNFFTWHFNEIAVRGLPARSVARLRQIGPRDLERLGVLAELRADEHGVLQHVTPGPNAGPDKGVRMIPHGIQLGLTSDEIAAVEQRRVDLLRRIDGGELILFAAPQDDDDDDDMQ